MRHGVSVHSIVPSSPRNTLNGGSAFISIFPKFRKVNQTKARTIGVAIIARNRIFFLRFFALETGSYGLYSEFCSAIENGMSVNFFDREIASQ